MYHLIRPHGRILHPWLSADLSTSIQRIFSRDKSSPAVQSTERTQLPSSDLKSASMASTQLGRDSAAISSDLVSLLRPSATSKAVERVTEKRKLPETVTDKLPVPFDEIPGPAILKALEKYWKYVPLLGRLTWNRNVTPLNYFFREYGPVVRIRGPMMSDVVMIHRPEHIAEVFKQETNLPVRSGIDILEHYRISHRKSKLAEPFSTHSGEWLATKAELMKLLSQHSKSSVDQLNEISDEFVERILVIRNRQDEVPPDFDRELLCWSMECFFLLMFNERFGFLNSTGLNDASEQSKIIEAVMSAHQYISRCETGFQVWRFFETPYSQKLFETCDFIDGVISKCIHRAQRNLQTLAQNESGSSVLEKLLVNQKMRLDDLSTILLDFIILGIQAVSNTEAFLLYFLAKSPRIQRKVFDEVVSVMPNCESPLDESGLEKLSYLKACLQECLRLRPAFPYLSRLLSKNVVLHGYEIPKGTYVIMASEISSRREENFEDPEKFIPERWLSDKSGEFSDCWSFLPFGYGAGSCPGKSHAEMELLMLTAKLIRNSKIEYDYGKIGSKLLIVNVPNKPLRFRFVSRD